MYLDYFVKTNDWIEITGSLNISDQHYALITTPLFITQAPTCFGIHVPSSGSFLCPYELLERQKWLCCLSCTVNVGGLCALVVVVSCVTLSR
jgi:hypothetical protein